jgi:tetratricopeptide (TPR) repeat protein
MPGSRPKKTANNAARLRLLLALLIVSGASAAWFWLAPGFEERRLEAATLSQLEALSKENKDNERVLYYLAARREQQGLAHEAMDAYWHALQRDANDERAWLGWARTTEKALGSEQAKKVLETCLQAHPGYVSALALLAQIHQHTGDHQAAFDAASRGIKLEPDNRELLRVMGSEAMVLERPLDAEAAFRKAILRDPSDWRDHAGMGDALSRLARRTEAVTAFREAVRLAPQIAPTHLLLGSELLRLARTDAEIEEARRELMEAINRTDDLPKSGQFQAALGLGDSYARQRRWQDALAWYRKAEHLMPYDPTAPYQLIRVYRGLGDLTNARQAAARHQMLDAVNLEIKVNADRVASIPQDTEALLKLARLYARYGQIEKAIQNYQALLSIKPQMASARKELQALLNSSDHTTP